VTGDYLEIGPKCLGSEEEWARDAVKKEKRHFEEMKRELIGCASEHCPHH
jgi:Cys-tRNA synthase (O-phospho-L-seryl-tRNA:Cys-tRNA synthase)